MTRQISQAGAELIKGSERLCLKVYRCAAGVLTIGWGHTGPDVFEGEEITESEAALLFRRDIARFERCVEKTCPKTTQAQFDAMVSLCFNIGQAAFRNSSVARLHNAGKYAEAAQAFALWNKGGGRVLPGLVNRRAAEAALYIYDDVGFVDEYASTAEGEKPLSASRAVNGQTAAAGATLLGTGLEAVRQHTDWFSDAQDVITQLLPYFDTLKWALLAVVVAGLGVAIYARVHDRHTGRA